MGFDFTIAVAPSSTSLDKELQYIKSALLYADKVTLISPMAYLYTQLSRNQHNEHTALRLLNLVMPFCRMANPEFYDDSQPVISQFTDLLNSKKYKAVPTIKRLEIRRMLQGFGKAVQDTIESRIGEEQCSELKKLLRADKLILQKFEHPLDDAEGCTVEFFNLLTSSIHNAYPLFDEQSSALMKAAVDEKLVCLSDFNRKKITHAGVSDNFIQRLPSFDAASVDEIIDIKKELAAPLVRFRSKMLAYTDDVQSAPWDDDFEMECLQLYIKEVQPALLEIQELTKENSFIKNLGRSFFTDEASIKSVGGLVVSIAAAGVLKAFSEAASTNAAVYLGGTLGVPKVASAYVAYRQANREIEKKDLYFYYKAGKQLER